MAIFHLCAKTMSRSSGHSATGGAAYRSASKIIDARKGLVHDYSRKRDVLKDDCRVILPGGGTADRSDLWNKVEQHHKRGDAVLAREVEISLPRELSRSQRLTLALDFANEIAEKFGVAADVCLHSSRTVSNRDLKMKPDQYHETDENGRRHNGNWHAHIMLSACHVSSDGTLGKKCVELDPIHCQRARIENMTEWGRARWNALANAALEKAKIEARIDHRSHVDRGILSEPSRHLGPAAFGYELRTGKLSSRRLQDAADAAERLAKAKEAGELERRAQSIRRSLFDLSCDISAAKAECEELREQQKIEDIKEHFERQRQATEAARTVAVAPVPLVVSVPVVVPVAAKAERDRQPSLLTTFYENIKKLWSTPVPPSVEPPKTSIIKFGLGSKAVPVVPVVVAPVPEPAAKPAPSIKFGRGSKAVLVVPVPVSNAEPPKPPVVPVPVSKAEPPKPPAAPVNWFDLTGYGLAVFKVRGENNHRDLVVAGASINRYEHELTELGFTRFGEHFRVPLTIESLTLSRWRQAFPNVQMIKVDAREILIDEATLQDFLESNPVDSYDVTTLQMERATEGVRPQNALEAAISQPEPEPESEPTRPSMW